MKTKKHNKKITYRKITHRKHYRKKNVIKSKKRYKSTRCNNKKYKGGALADFDMSHYTFNSLQNMLDSLQMLIEIKNKKRYENSILDVILKPIRIKGTINDDIFNSFPQLIKLILKLEVKPSNTLELIYYILDVKDEEDKEGLKKLLDIHPQLIEFIDKNRNETDSEDYDVGWSLLSSFVESLVEVMDISDAFDFKLKEKIQTVYNTNSMIQCGLMDTFLDDIQLVNPDDKLRYKKSKLNIFYDNFRYISNSTIHNTLRRDTVNRKPLKTIYDFFDITKNPTGILPPFVLFILTCRFNPRINKDIDVMKKHRTTVLNQIQYYLTICCKKCCINGACTESKCVDKNYVPTNNDSTLLTIARIPQNICPHNCINDLSWNTFDHILKLATQNGSIVQTLIEETLFYNIVPLSTFLPINANTYIQDVFFKKEKNEDDERKKRIKFDNKIKFYENEIYKAYKQAQDGLCGSEYNSDLCANYLRDGPLYIPYDLLLLIIEKYEKRDKPSTLAKVIGKARSNRDTILKKASEKAEKSASASKTPSLPSRMLQIVKRIRKPKPKLLENIRELDEESHDDAEFLEAHSSNRSPEKYLSPVDSSEQFHSLEATEA
jgi:hypothetical protein